jgi:hypothetical protein
MLCTLGMLMALFRPPNLKDAMSLQHEHDWQQQCWSEPNVLPCAWPFQSMVGDRPCLLA